jgi:uncharacterized membrane protein YphA (DoxX/SURF4 family)
LLIVAGVLVRLACLPILFVLLVALLIVHPQWSLAEGQFGWLLLILFTSILIAGPGRWRSITDFPEPFVMPESNLLDTPVRVSKRS